MRGDRGAALLEVIVSALVLFIATGATLAVLDGSSRASADNRDRLVAANLAERDQERLRGLSLVSLRAGPGQADPETVNGIVYEVTSQTRAITDALGSQPTCTSGSDTREDYLLLTTTVRRSDGGMSPFVMRSLLAPRASTTGYKGSLSVPFTDRNDTPLSGIATSVTGPDPDTTVTSTTSNASGCAVFRDLDAGTYAVAFSRAGYVTPNGTTGTVNLSGTIVPGQTNFTATQPYDVAAEVTGRVRTVRPSGADVSATAAALSVTTTDVRAGGVRTFPVSPVAASLPTGKTLFPFTVPYTAFTGSCVANAPPAGAPAQTVSVGPGGSADVTVYSPTVLLRAQSGQTISRAFVRSTDTGCTQLLPYTFTAAATAEIAVPYGSWSICVDNNGTRSQTRPVAVQSRTATTLDFAGATTVSARCAAT